MKCEVEKGRGSRLLHKAARSSVRPVAHGPQLQFALNPLRLLVPGADKRFSIAASASKAVYACGAWC
ncbi:hypothetical protein IG631_02875 [Alternaria alternata]|nr:hypothetical protein IG631_02875 [Alternaria alternata]